MGSHATIILGMVGLKKPLKGEYQVALFMGTLKTITLEDTVIKVMGIKATSRASIHLIMAQDKDSMGTLTTWLAINKLATSGGVTNPIARLTSITTFFVT